MALLFRLLVIAWLTLILTTGKSIGQVQHDPTPRLLVNTGGPAGRVTGLKFSADSSRLYAAGTDKSVHVWQITSGVDGHANAHFADSMRWEIARADRGHIYAMAISPTREELAVGGRCMRGQEGDICVFDTAVGRIRRVLPETRSDDPQTQPFGHWSRIHHLSYSPSGNELVSVSADNEMRLWRRAADWKSIVLRRYSDIESPQPLPALFVDQNKIVAAEQAGSGSQIVAYQVARGAAAGRQVIRNLSTTVIKMVSQPHVGLWATSTSDGAVTLNTRGGEYLIQRPGDRIGECLAFVGDTILVVCNRTRQGKGAGIDLYDIAQRRRLRSWNNTGQPYVSSVTVSPDGQWIALNRKGQQSLELFKPDPNRPSIDSESVTVIRPHGRPVRYVSFSQDNGYVVAFDDNRVASPGAGTRFFDLASNRMLQKSDSSGWRTPTSDNDGWRVQTPDASGNTIEFWKHNVRRGSQMIDTGAQGTPQAACLIPDRRGNPVAAAIATAGAPGIFVYSLPGTQGTSQILRYFRDHTNDIVSLSASHDGRYLVSGSLDQTIRVWSLAELKSESRLSATSIWGARFVVNAVGRLEAADVHPAGIAFARGIRDGDIIDRFRCTIETATATRMVDATKPSEILAAMSSNKPFHNANVSWHRGGQEFQRNIVAGWESLLTLFVDNHDEWVLFSPSGYFTSSAAEGHRLMSWQFNRGPGVHPRVVSGGDLRRQLERPLLFRNIMKAGSLHGAAKEIKANADALSFDTISRVTGNQPELMIDSPRLDIEHDAHAQVAVRATIQVPAGKSPHDYRIMAYANGLPVPVVVDSGGVVSGTAPADNSLGRLRVLVYDDSGLTASAETSYRVTGVTPRPLRLHYLILGADKYQGMFKPLQFAVADATAVENSLQESNGDFYTIARDTSVALHDSEINRHSVTEAINSLISSLVDADAEDLLIVYMAGHGTVSNGSFCFIPPDVTSLPEIETAGIRWSDFLRLADIPCRKLVLIDACKAGTTVSSPESEDQQLKASIRPLVDAGMIVLSATNDVQNAYEIETFGHGAFTNSLLRGLSGRADGQSDKDSRDGIVALREAVIFVTRDVPQQLLQRNLYQQPTVAPRSLVELLNVKLMTARAAP